MLYDIKDIYTYNQTANKPMLSNFTSTAGGSVDFWKPYKDNHAYFDRMFMKKYRSWYPMDQDGDLEDISDEFAYDVKAWLMINDKRYSELYRMQTIPDDSKYSLTDNVSEHEVIETEYGKVETYNKGSQQITDSGTATYGAHTDTQDNSRTYGEQQIDTDATNTTGATGKTITDSTSAFNDSTFANVDKTEEDNDSREDTVDQTVVNGAHTDTEDLSTTYGTHTDTSGNTRTDGARSDTTSDTGTDTTTRDRTGNIGVRTVDEMLTIHKDTWVDFSFYEIIFAEITRELLRGGVY